MSSVAKLYPAKGSKLNSLNSCLRVQTSGDPIFKIFQNFSKKFSKKISKKKFYDGEKF